MKGELQMKLYVVIEVIDDYPEDGGGEYPDAVFLNYINAEKYATRKRQEAIAWDKTDVYYSVETWETADEMENAE
jgi:hypothetical protein